MWWCSRLAALLGLMLALSACGFSPAYAPGGPGDQFRGQVLVQAPTNREDFTFAARIEDRLGRNPAATFQLGYKISTSAQDLAITGDQQIQRYNLLGSVDYTITSATTGGVLTSGTASGFTGYSATGTTVATRAAERDAYARLMQLLADQVITQLVASGPRWQP